MLASSTSTTGAALTLSSLVVVFFSSPFLLPAAGLVLLTLAPGLAMAAARAAATLSAAADGLTGVVVLAALLVVAEDEFRAKLELEVLEEVPVSLLLLPAEDEAVLAVVVVVVVALLAGALGTVPVFFSSGFTLVVAVAGLAEDTAGLDLLLEEVELALDVCPDRLDGGLLVPEPKRRVAAGLGSLLLPGSGLGLAVVGFLVPSSFLGSVGFRS